MTHKCPDCDSSGKRYLVIDTYVNRRKKKGVVLKLKCLDCGHAFITEDLTEVDAKSLLVDIQQAFSNELLREVQFIVEMIEDEARSEFDE